MTENGTILVGLKPVMSYVTAAQIQLNNSAQVCLKSRGKFTSKAIDAAEVLKRIGNATVKAISTDSTSFKVEGGKEVRVSTIEIVLEKAVSKGSP